ncbi:MAG TPA: ABC transporter permease [Chloroflexia bacterium]|nr:ABC transporter permease [Chloroflexia bacterium]
MRRFIIRRLWQSVLLVLAILLLNFFILRLTPGDPYSTLQYQMLQASNGNELNASQQRQLNDLRQRMGLYLDPWPQAFISWASGLIHFDFGNSVVNGQPLTPQLKEAAIGSFWLLFFAALFGAVLGIPLGIYSAYRAGTWKDKTIKILTGVFVALPGWFMLQLVQFLNQQLWEATGRHFSIIPIATNELEYARNSDLVRFWHNCLPVVFLGAVIVALLWGQSRAQTLEVLSEDYVRTARAKGLRSREIVFRHVFRTSLSPLITIFGGLLPFVFGAQVLIEYFGKWSGLGYLFLNAASQRDYTMLMGVFTLLALTCVICSLLADIAYGIVDPRVSEKAK